jgi:circadian clock protein KaiB
MPDTQQSAQYVLRLYIAGSAPSSLRALANVRSACAQRLGGRHRLDVIDIYQQPALAAQSRVVAAPVLIRVEPPPVRRLVGVELSTPWHVLAGITGREGGPRDHDQ